MLVEKINSIHLPLCVDSIFITKKKDEISDFVIFCEKKQIQIFSHSFISFNKVTSTFKLPSQVYFFSSKNGVNFFLTQHIIETNKKIACVGESTKTHLENLGYQVDFYVENAGNPIAVAHQLKEWLGERRISFICSNIGKKTISNAINDHQKEEVVFYETKIKSRKINENFDVYVFTSPSNVKGFLNENSIPNNSITIAWGKTTEEALISNKQKVNFVLNNSTFEELKGLF